MRTIYGLLLLQNHCSGPWLRTLRGLIFRPLFLWYCLYLQIRYVMLSCWCSKDFLHIRKSPSFSYTGKFKAACLVGASEGLSRCVMVVLWPVTDFCEIYFGTCRISFTFGTKIINRDLILSCFLWKEWPCWYYVIPHEHGWPCFCLGKVRVGSSLDHSLVTQSFLTALLFWYIYLISV